MSSSVAVKISPDLAEAARAEAGHSDRSLTGQIEHWAKLGQVVDHLLPGPVASALKQARGNAETIEDPAMKERALFALAEVHKQAYFQWVASDLLSAGGPRYEVDSSDPQGIVQVRPDGTRVRGRLIARKFVPLAG